MMDTKLDLFDELSRVNNELVNTQRELYKKNAELVELSNQKNFFLGMLAHDLRNPLGNVLNVTQLVEAMLGVKLDEESKEYLDMIADAVQLMLAMVNDTLEIAKMDSPNLKIDLQQEDIIEVVNNAMLSNKLLCDHKRLQLEFIHPGVDALMMSIDKTRIHQLLNNLITNAVKFSFPNNKITVKLDQAENGIILSVQDYGKGVPEKELKDLFKPFHLTSVNSTAGEKRTGLGLTIVEKIAKAHGGRVWVESTVDVGSTFFVSIPC